VYLNTWIVLQALSTTWMTAIIWIVQLLIYPTFLKMHKSEFADFHNQHSQRITWLVGPVMILELACSVVLLRSELSLSLAIANFITVLAVFALTFFVSVPIHNQLGLGFSTAAAQQLVRTNWWRTFVWTLRFVGVLSFLIIKS